MTSAASVLSHIIGCHIKTAANALSAALKDVVPAFKAETPVTARIAPALSETGIKEAPLPQLKPSVVNGIVPQVRSNAPVLRSHPALQARSVFKPVAAAEKPPAPVSAPAAAPSAPEFAPQPAPGNPADRAISAFKTQEQNLAGDIRNPNLDPSARIQMQDRLRKLYDKISTGPALELTNFNGHRLAQAQRAIKIRQQLAAEQEKLLQQQQAAVAPTAVVNR